eukprot:1165075-Amphidinium_carterae.1
MQKCRSTLCDHPNSNWLPALTNGQAPTAKDPVQAKASNSQIMMTTRPKQANDVSGHSIVA